MHHVAAASKEIRRMLRDEALQKLISKIDSSEDAEKVSSLFQSDDAIQDFGGQGASDCSESCDMG
jgi:hypothetical protein